MKKLHSIIISFLLLFIMAGCHPDEPVVHHDVVVEKGVLVLNEGNFTYANSSLTYYDVEKDSTINNLFYRVNGSPIGDTGQSLCMINGKLYIVVNNSKYIYKVDAKTIYCDTTQPYILKDLACPRFMLPLDPNKAYVSDLMSTQMWIMDPQTMTLSGSIDMGKTTETMVQVGREVYVTNWSKYYVNEPNNTVQVVDAEQDVKVAEIEVGYEPNGMVVDKNGMIWVLCEGDANDMDVPSTLWQIDPYLKRSIQLRSFEKKAMNLAIDPSGTLLYYFVVGDDYVSNEVHRCSIDSPYADDGFCIAMEGSVFYKIAVNPANGDIYVSDAKNYSTNGKVYRYSSDGLLLSSFDAGICPSFFLFLN